MSTLYIQEYESIARNPGGLLVPVGLEPAMASQTVAMDLVTSAQSAAFNSATNFVRVVASADCRIVFGEDPTADADAMPLKADTPEYFGVRKGLKLAVLEVPL